MITTYEFLSIIQAVEQAIAQNGVNYPKVLETVRSVIAEKHSAELFSALDSADAAQTLKSLILKYSAEVLAGQEFNRSELVERLYQDMAGLGVLTNYLHDPNVEEINIDSYDLIEIIYNDHIKYLYDEAFSSPSPALDIVKRMVRMGGMLLDAQTPQVDSYTDNGTRISAMIPPIVPQARGVSASIRKQNNNRITREQLLKQKFASEDMLDFATKCLCNGVSLGLAGGTDAGKTTVQTYLLNEYIRNNEDYNCRVVVISDSWEIKTIDYDEEHERPARVIYMLTQKGVVPVTMLDLIVSSLRYHPALIVPAEVRDAAAWEAANAGQTGHTILTTFHANSAHDAYKRLVSMCHAAKTGLSDEHLLEMCVSAWPVMIFQKRLKDKTRKFMEIFEATGVEHGKLQGHMLYRFVISKTERDERGRVVQVHGEHKRVGTISPRLFCRLHDNGVPEAELYRLFPDATPDGGAS